MSRPPYMVLSTLHGLHDPEGSNLDQIKHYITTEFKFDCGIKKQWVSVMAGIDELLKKGTLKLDGEKYKIDGYDFPNLVEPWKPGANFSAKQMIVTALHCLHDPQGSKLEIIKLYLESKLNFDCKEHLDLFVDGLNEGINSGEIEVYLESYKIGGHEFVRGSKPAMVAAKKRRVPVKEEKVKDLFRAMGVNDLDRVSGCLKAAVQKGHIKVTGDPSDLDQIVMSGRLDRDMDCGHAVKATIGNLLYQPDEGIDYDDGMECTTVRCSEKDEYYLKREGRDEPCRGRICVTRLCVGRPEWDMGKFHNHCIECKQKGPFGICFGDNRNRHCYDFGKHYWGPCGCECRRNPDSDLDDGWGIF